MQTESNLINDQYPTIWQVAIFQAGLDLGITLQQTFYEPTVGYLIGGEFNIGLGLNPLGGGGSFSGSNKWILWDPGR